ncbi:hypothetical protein [Mycetocola zhujimingii]|uniref:hypothetical protein n=1 Tax=Mycetocola zhujimingii TaxID=2079792 RepID=UPI000D392415|nr:hypothetical protein [Mycetocola zhujimingii]AWB87237.1 hypothetical protein C3E77_11830 [Mycetocola zhujimingii]
MTARKPLPHELTGRPFTVTEARALGVSRARLAGGDLAHPFSGIRTPAGTPVHDPVSADDWRQVFQTHQRRTRELCAAFDLRMPSGGFYCGPTAALLHGVPLPYRLSSDTRLHIGLPEGCRAVQAIGTIGHSYSIDEAEIVSGALGRLTGPERTWCDLARYLPLTELVAAGDYLIRRTRPLTSTDRLAAAVTAYTGRRGVKTLRRALELLNNRAESPKESILRVELVLAGLPSPEINVDVFDRHGRFIARVDMMFRQHRLILEYEGLQHLLDADQWTRDIRRTRRLEYEGLQHLLDADQWTRDIRRTRRLESEGWRVIRVTQADLHNLRSLVGLITAHLTASC